MKKRPSSTDSLEDKRNNHACGATSISERARSLSSWKAATFLLCNGSSRRDFHACALLRALGGSIMPASYRSDLSCPCSL